MTKAYLASLSGTLFSGDQRQALDTIGGALERHHIDFGTASELFELVKDDRAEEALEQLARVQL